MRPNEEPHKGDCPDGSTHACPIEETKGPVVLQDVTDNWEYWEYENIHLRMPKESEQMLVQDGVPTSSNVKELRIKIPIHEDHSNGTCKNWNNEANNPRRYNHTDNKRTVKIASVTVSLLGISRGN